jgi:hypothetical protein
MPESSRSPEPPQPIIGTVIRFFALNTPVIYPHFRGIPNYNRQAYVVFVTGTSKRYARMVHLNNLKAEWVERTVHSEANINESTVDTPVKQVRKVFVVRETVSIESSEDELVELGTFELDITDEVAQKALPLQIKHCYLQKKQPSRIVLKHDFELTLESCA